MLLAIFAPLQRKLLPIQLISGRIRIFNGHQDGRENILAIGEPGGLFGEAACFDGVPYYTTAVTVQPSRIRVFPREATLRAMRAQPDIMLEILRSITRKQRLFAILIETLMFRKAPARVALILSRLATYYGETVPKDAVLASAFTFPTTCWPA